MTPGLQDQGSNSEPETKSSKKLDLKRRLSIQVELKYFLKLEKVEARFQTSNIVVLDLD